ncbi:MAG: sporulation protein YabP [Oscillospiraceae bacterium]|nr:sporulation protein YabP [Clostridiales bacterium]MDD6107624.1 sporulation protein YabP [Clostridiales bacterium]MDY6095028.1 sporulation protein YabP [Oscillospiraceae bacterium]
MAYEDKKNPTVRRPHSVILEERTKLTVTGVDEVLSFDENEVTMRTSRGSLIVRGSELHVGKLAIDTGELGIDGTVSDLLYEEEQQRGEGFWARLFG